MTVIDINKEAVVIGAGWSGIYALKHLAEEGLDCMSFDKREDVGGLWAHTTDQSVTSVPDCTYTSSPKLFTEATDFPWPKEIGIYPRYDEVHAWLKSYVEHFKLSERIMLRSQVESVEKKEGLWRMKVLRRLADGREERLLVTSKYLVVSSGVNMALNNLSDNERIKGFTGQVIHSNEVRKISEYQDAVKDKRVVCIGGGENASDLTYFGSLMTKTFTLCVPNGQWMQVRNFLTRTVPIHKVAPVTQEKLGPMLPWEYQKSVLRCWIRPMWGSNGWDRYAVRAANGEFGHGQEQWKPVGPCYGNFGNKADLIHHALQAKRVVAKRDITHCEGKTVHFSDGTCQEDIDMILLCTGYCLCFPFLPEEFRPKKIRGLYKNIFHPEDPTLAFVGFSRPTQGSIPQLSELASIFVSRVFAGKVQLPDAKTLVEVADKDCKDWDLFFRYSSGRVTGLVDQILYSRVVCEAMGARFGFLEMLWQYGPVDWLLYQFSPATLHTYLGKIPEKREVFLKFIRENSLFKLSFQQAIGGLVYGVYDLLYYQLGRLENMWNETFDERTRSVVGKERARKESKIEKWWLSYFWDTLCLALLGLALFGHAKLVGMILLGYTIAMMSVHFTARNIISLAAFYNRGYFSRRYGVKEM